MSANFDLVRSICAAWERGDFSTLDWAHPEIEFVSADGPEPGVRRGVSEMVEGFRSSMRAWDDWCFVAESYREVDNERILVLTPVRARGKTSALSVTNEGATLFQVREGRVIRIVTYWDPDRALADLGLASKGDPTDSQ
jgi:ketosteroid isomerase-like protein